ncbi:Pentatricopeptide repeat-containing protein [Melia azedarach]|uniref:Pentatricopeptide repeat-containing protein n=1 Tax=Melia azedarach TaxID=155640 RepID=A0ACC1X8L4_MELAZ|nr:Pentatricopeptide repeat-containing protein [Melia azedarach]
MISEFTSNGFHSEAFDLILLMRKECVMLIMLTIISVSKAIGQLGDVDKGKEFQSFASELGMKFDMQVGTAVLDMCSKCGSLHDARAVFGSNFINCGANMPIECNDFWLLTKWYLWSGNAVHGMVLKSGSEMMVISVYNAIVDAYAKCRALEDVRKQDGGERDSVLENSADFLFSMFEWEEALTTFSQTREEGFRPNQFTFSSVHVCCAGLCLLEFGKQVHSLLCKAGLDADKCIESALLDMYAKCGSISKAEAIFGRISNPDTVSWTAMISGLCSTCHGGLVDEGLYYFQLMEEKYCLVPEVEHYACIVDLFGCVGCLDDAMDFIKKMPIEPNEMVWQTLLAACRIHGNAELGEIAAQKVLSVRPDSATYVLLSNMYIETGSYEDGLTLREDKYGTTPSYTKLSEVDLGGCATTYNATSCCSHAGSGTGIESVDKIKEIIANSNDLINEKFVLAIRFCAFPLPKKSPIDQEKRNRLFKYQWNFCVLTERKDKWNLDRFQEVNHMGMASKRL